MAELNIARINELYHKAKTTGLTPEEAAEQAELRRAYIASIRESVRDSLNNVSIEEADGTVTDLGEKYGGKVRS